ncbi:MAG: DUF1344 domain-containing protein [Desulfobacterales bacterium]|nr:DUF1344 domain-containing protein [Desulfobacterales bacterium]
MRKKLALTLALAFVLVFAVQALAKDMEGEVTAIDKAGKTITITDTVVVDVGDVDLSGIAVGDTVKATYSVEGKKNILKSISKVEAEEEFILLEGC